jgi:hypothetical protein
MGPGMGESCDLGELAHRVSELRFWSSADLGVFPGFLSAMRDECGTRLARRTPQFFSARTRWAGVRTHARGRRWDVCTSVGASGRNRTCDTRFRKTGDAKKIKDDRTRLSLVTNRR